jgi:hypothetical protein
LKYVLSNLPYCTFQISSISKIMAENNRSLLSGRTNSQKLIANSQQPIANSQKPIANSNSNAQMAELFSRHLEMSKV